MRRILAIAALCLCATPAAAQEPTPTQSPARPVTQDATQAERDRKEREKQGAKADAGQPQGEKASPAGIERELTALDQEWTQAGVKGDASILERVLADDYSAANALGKSITKAEAIADLKSGATKLDTNTADNYNVRVFGDTAVMTHDGVRTGRREGKAFTERYRSLHVFVRRGGRWQAVASQGMTLPQQ